MQCDTRLLGWKDTFPLNLFSKKGCEYEKSNILLVEYCKILNVVFKFYRSQAFWKMVVNTRVSCIMYMSYSDTSLGAWVQIHSWNQEFGACTDTSF